MAGQGQSRSRWVEKCCGVTSADCLRKVESSDPPPSVVILFLLLMLLLMIMSQRTHLSGIFKLTKTEKNL